ncbi:MAG: hypothetical protein D6680_03225 [Cyanobacteria bacterium J007]|nr:MAG: hypothetical protein D6680_03225 [Cyanobacteria bacterium J007]
MRICTELGIVEALSDRGLDTGKAQRLYYHGRSIGVKFIRPPGLFPDKKANPERSQPTEIETKGSIWRRGAASVLEITLLVASALGPWGAGEYLRTHEAGGDRVPLHPVLARAQDAIAPILALPRPCDDRTGRSCVERVPPATNLLWMAAIVAPVTLGAWQLYALGKTGQTLPKRWFRVEVLAVSGRTPGLLRAVVRELVGRWGMGVGLAYCLWRYGGAVPDLTLLGALAAGSLALDSLNACFDRDRRALHDRVAGTLAIDAALESFYTSPLQNCTGTQGDRLDRVKTSQAHRSTSMDSKAKISPALVPLEQVPAGIHWMRRPLGWGLALGIGLSTFLVTWMGTQIYVEGQQTLRDRAERERETFLALVEKFAPDERQGAILALGNLDAPDAGIQLLADLLGLENDGDRLEAIQQALVSSGPRALPYLKTANQAVRADLDALRYSADTAQRQMVERRLQATQRAIAKLLKIHSGDLDEIDLNRTHLGRLDTDAAFALVLEKTDLSGIQLRGARLDGASFRGSLFYGAGSDRRFGTFDDRKADLTASTLTDADLRAAFLSQAILENTDLQRANLSSANLSQAKLNRANLSSVRAIDTDFQQATLAEATFTGANLGEANFAGAQLEGARLTRTEAVGSNWRAASVMRTNWQDADLTTADFTQANLQQANFSSAQLNGADFTGANLQQVNFQRADLSAAVLRGATLDGADFQGVNFTVSSSSEEVDFIKPSSESEGVDLLTGVNFNSVRNLDDRQIEYICARGGIHDLCSPGAESW